MIFKVKILLSIMLLLFFVVPSAAADFTYQEYAKAPEAWKRGFVFGISQYMSAVAQPDEEAPYPVRTAFQRCLASSTELLASSIWGLVWRIRETLISGSAVTMPENGAAPF